MTDTALSDTHRAELEVGSGIDPQAIDERGYFTARKIGDLKRFGFGESQAMVPALGIPIWGPEGRVVLYQSKPDRPRINTSTGRPIKYETPRKATMVLDVPPRARPYIGDPHTPVAFTEGIKKVDSAVSNGFACAIGLLGVWNFRGTNADGGKVVLAELEYIACNGREALIIFDSDVMRKREVYGGLKRLANILAYRGARVKFVYLPDGEGGQKTGLDDYFVAGHSRDDVLALAEDELRPPPVVAREGEEVAGPYRMSTAGIVLLKETNQGTVPVQITNFPAKITGNIAEDDGAEVRRLLEVSVLMNGQAKTIRLTPEKFAAMAWPVELLGPVAVVYPGNSIKDHGRAGIQLLSGDVEEHLVFAHTGWREIDGEWVYLHGGGAIGRRGSVPGIETALPGDLERFLLLDPPEGADMVAAVRASLRMIDIAPGMISIPILASVYRAALGETDYSIIVAGPSGAFKTQIAALAQQHYGAGMDARHLPANWSSTPNSLEGLAFAAKDVLLVFDDFAPSGSFADVTRLHGNADRLLRGQGNHAGRQRMTHDARLRSGKPSRSLPLMTGEDVPKIQSARARALIVEVGPDDVEKDKLSAAQRDAAEGQYAAALSGFVRWIAPQYAAMQTHLAAETVRLRDEAIGSAAHSRTPGIIASLAAGWRIFLDFAVEVNAISAREAQDAWARGWAALGRSVSAQSAHQAASDPVIRFLELVKSAIGSGSAHIADDRGQAPSKTDWSSGPRAWGWRSFEVLSGDNSYQDWRPQGDRIGWVDDAHVYLDRDAAIGVAQKVGRDIGDSIAITPHTLAKRLKERGYLASVDTARETNTIRRVLDGAQRNVLHLHSSMLAPPGGDDSPDTPTDDPAA